jgi:hypothetical protein
MNVLYLHGLESKPTGPKMRYLKDRFLNYYAPEIDYKNPEAFEEIVDLCIAEEFDMIIGSSMGGYFACALSSQLGTPVIVFNPALHSRTFDPYGVTMGSKAFDGACVLGMDDDVINPIATYEMLETHDHGNKMAIIPIEGMGHQVPFTEFIEAIEKIVPEEVE